MKYQAEFEEWAREHTDLGEYLQTIEGPKEFSYKDPCANYAYQAFAYLKEKSRK